jgi:hypothetical protein
MTLQELRAWGEPIRQKAALIREECQRQIRTAYRISAESARIREEALAMLDRLPEPYPEPVSPLSQTDG